MVLTTIILGRRRKLRCSFEPGTAVCTHCSVRGTHCVDQRDAPATLSRGNGSAYSSPRAPTSRRGRVTKAKGVPAKSGDQPFIGHREQLPFELARPDNTPAHRGPIVAIIGEVNVSGLLVIHLITEQIDL